MARPDYVTKSPEESRAVMRALDAGVAPRVVVGALLGRPEKDDKETPTVPAPARADRRPAAPPAASRAAGVLRSVVGAPTAIAQEGASDTALSRLFTAVVVGALVLEVGSLVSGKFFSVSTGQGSPFPLDVRAAPAGKVQTPASAANTANAAAAAIAGAGAPQGGKYILVPVGL